MRKPAPLSRALAALAGVLCILSFVAAEAAEPELPNPDQPVALIADDVTYDTDTQRVTASGHVEVYYGDRTLTADKIVYDDRTGRITAEGDLVLRDPSGATVFASAADLDAQLKNGIVSGAKAVIAGDVKLAAVEARRVDDRYNTLSKAVYSPCQVCSADPTPLWAIRARRVIHDQVEKIIYYKDATFLVWGVPVAWVPYFWHPDPTVDRASGFLVPSFLSSSIFGYALKVPYYWAIDPWSDLTITPFITTDDGLLMEGEYRRLFSNGDLRFRGTITRDDYTGGDRIHGFVDTHGKFDIGADVKAGWDVTFASDDAFLRRYDYDRYGDRLTSDLFVRRYKRDEFFDIEGVRFQSLRVNEPAGQIPLALPVVEARKDFDALGGDLGIFTSGYLLNRTTGRDDGRLSIGADWQREEVLPIGLSVTGFAQLRGDIFTVNNDPTITNTQTARLTGLAGVTMRYPLIWEPEGGATHILEPVVQGIMAPYGLNDDDIPNEDSLVTEFDTTNVIDINHFSGIDRFEEGPRINLLLRYDRISKSGLRFDAEAGRVFRFRRANGFSAGSGLATAESDFVTSWQATYNPYVVVRHRMRFADDGTIRSNELFGSVTIDPVDIAANYTFLAADPAAGAPIDRVEVSATAALRLNRNWSISGIVQRDLQLNQFVIAGGQVTYQNECAAIDVFLRRRFTSTIDAPASTSVGVNVRLLTLGTTDVGQGTRGNGLFGGGSGCG